MLGAKKKSSLGLSSICRPLEVKTDQNNKSKNHIDILLIDDEVFLCETLKDLLEDEGYSVAIATNGKEGLRFLEEKPCLVAIVDIMLPDTSGLDILKEIKDKGIECLPIMLTAFATVETSIKALNEGAYAYIIKPYKIDEVKATIRNAIEKQRLSIENKALFRNLQKTNKNLTRVTKELEELNRDLEDKVLERTKELAEAKDKMDKIMASIAEGLLSMDKDFRITSFNRAAEQITGYKTKEVLNKYCWEVFKDIDFKECIKEIIKMNKPAVNIEKVVHTKNRGNIPVLASIDVLKDEEGNVIGGVKTFRDITMLKRMQEELKETNRELMSNQRALKEAYWELEKSKEKLSEWAEELDRKVRLRTRELQEANEKLRQANIRLTELDRLKSKFLATVSHEIKTPLTSIIGYANLLINQKKQTFTNEQIDSLNRIKRNSNTLQDLIDQLLDLSKIESGKLEVHLEVVYFKEIIEEVIYITEQIVKQKGIMVKTFLPDQLLPIQADRAKIKQILLNLLTNAVKYTEKENGEIHIRVIQNSSKITVSIEDQGIGISREDQKVIFDPFRQARGPLYRKYGGTGLGLSIVKEFVRLHGGDIWVESEPGKGSKFSFTLPI
ncbi:MAG: ATP-binding protein [bacterium]